MIPCLCPMAFIIGGVKVNEDTLDLRTIGTILAHKNEIKNNPFSTFPKESIEEVFSMLEERKEKSK